MSLHLREGTNLKAAAGNLRSLAEQGRAFAHAPWTESVRDRMNAYLNWVDSVELKLRNVFTDLEVLGHLRSDAYWEITRTSGDLVHRLTAQECVDDARWLDGLADSLDALATRLVAAPGLLIVLDTNVLLHYQRPSDVDWQKVIGVDKIRLVLPLRVIEELDEKKWLAREEVATRARGIVSDAWRRLESTAGGPVELRQGVTVEVPIDDGTRHRPLDADQEILDIAEEMRNVGGDMRLVTGDTGMSLRAVARRLKVVPMPDEYLRRRPQPASATEVQSAPGI